MSATATVGRLVAALLLVLSCSSLDLAQTTSASLAGRVSDKHGSPLPASVVQVRSDETGQVRTGVTDDDGEYRIDLLRPGRWTA